MVVVAGVTRCWVLRNRAAAVCWWVSGLLVGGGGGVLARCGAGFFWLVGSWSGSRVARVRVWCRLYVENFTVDASILNFFVVSSF